MGFKDNLIVPIHEAVLLGEKFSVPVVRFLHDLVRAIKGRVRWTGPYSGYNSYSKNDMVTDGGWTMIANKDTSDRPAPQAIGPELSLYSGSSPTAPITAKSVVTGTRVTATSIGFWLNSYEVYTVAGNNYRVFSVNAVGAVSELLSFNASSTGWLLFNLPILAIPTGSDFAILQSVSEPDPTPTVWTGDWNYLTPNNANNPLAGQAVQSDKLLGILKIHKTDDNGGNRESELLSLNSGDIIEALGMRWSIQSIADNATFVSFGVAPAQQGSPEGVTGFSFETVTATPITTMVDIDYWTNNPGTQITVSGLYSIDEDPFTETGSAYGINMNIQEASISDDWDLVAASSGSADNQGTGVTTAGYTGVFTTGQGANKKTITMVNGLIVGVS